jgi:hypothetical protein
MSFASPTPDLAHAEYTAQFVHSNGQTLLLKSSPFDAQNIIDPEDMDAAWTAAIALLDADANFTFQGGDKHYTTFEGYTL